MQKGAFVVFFWGGVVLSFPLVFLFFCFVKRPKKVSFLQFWRFFYFVPRKGLSLKSFFSSYSFFCFLFFLLYWLSKFHFLWFLSSTPSWKHYLCLIVLSFFVCPFPLLMFAWLFETNFPNIYLKQTFLTSLFLKPKLLSFLAVFCLQLCLFCFNGACFCLSVSFWGGGGALILVCFSFVIVLFFFGFLFVLRPWKKNCVPSNSSVLLSYVVYKVVYFLCFMIWFLFGGCSGVVCLQSKQWSCIVLRLCCLLCLFVARLSGFLVCILWSCFLFCCFVLMFICLVSHSSPQKTKNGHS